jgi:hypothetical protein
MFNFCVYALLKSVTISEFFQKPQKLLRGGGGGGAIFEKILSFSKGDLSFKNGDIITFMFNWLGSPIRVETDIKRY